MKKTVHCLLPISFFALLAAISCITLYSMGQVFAERFSAGTIGTTIIGAKFSGDNADAEKGAETNGNTTSNNSNYLNRLNKNMLSIVSSFEKTFTNHLGLRNELVGVNVLIRKNIFMEKSINGYTLDNSGTIQNPQEYSGTQYAQQQMMTLGEYCSEKKIKLLYVMPPSKVLEGKTQLPDGIRDYSNEMIDGFLDGIKDKVECLDLRDEMSDYIMNTSNVFYRTDHHWTTRTALEAFICVGNHLIQSSTLNFGDVSTILDRNSYFTESFEKKFVGVQAVKLSTYFSGIDDFELIYPSFSTDFTLTQLINSRSIEVRNGTFENTLIYRAMLQETPSTDCYSAYLSYGNTEKIIKNNTAPNDLKLLVIGDSFSRPFTCFLSSMFYETRTIDTQYDHISIQEYISEYEPDYVIVMLNSGTMKNEYCMAFDLE